ncbi:MAG: MerR family DNA-binding transcriptional regulator [Leptospirales bacterium]
MNRSVAIGETSEAPGVSIATVRRWETEGRLIPERTAGRPETHLTLRTVTSQNPSFFSV